MPDTYTVSRSTTIDAPANEIYGHMIDFRRWAAWSPWEEMDLNASKSFSGAESGVGSHYSWSGNRKVGQGSMEITDARQDAEIQIALEFRLGDSGDMGNDRQEDSHDARHGDLQEYGLDGRARLREGPGEAEVDGRGVARLRGS